MESQVEHTSSEDGEEDKVCKQAAHSEQTNTLLS